MYLSIRQVVGPFVFIHKYKGMSVTFVTTGVNNVPKRK